MASSIASTCTRRLMALSSSKRVSTLMIRRPITIQTVLNNHINTNKITTFHLSTQAAEAEEKPIIPGIGKGKTSTGLVGLDVEPDWYNIMNDKFTALLDKMEASDMPETAQYRIDVTKWCNYVLSQVKEYGPDDPEGIEMACKSGQVEELIEQAKDEMEVLDMYLESRMWELVEQANPTKIDFNPNPLGDDDDADVQESMKEGMEEMKK